jgi:hypothetical protein
MKKNSYIRIIINKKYNYSTRIKYLKDSIWTEFTPLAQNTSSINLGQGFVKIKTN